MAQTQVTRKPSVKNLKDGWLQQVTDFTPEMLWIKLTSALERKDNEVIIYHLKFIALILQVVCFIFPFRGRYRIHRVLFFQTMVEAT
jgi:hypothetical protein